MAEATALALLAAAAIVPGAVLASALGFEARSRVDGALAVVALGLTGSGSAVYLLLLLGGYTRWTAAVLLVAPALWLLKLGLRRDPRLRRLWPATSDQRVNPPVSRLDQAALALCALWLALAFVDAATSPPRFWDGIVTWDKWAMDWGRRRDLHGYLFSYAQLLPMFSSLAYKLLGTVDGDLPPAMCGVHALHPLLGVALLAAAWRLARLLGLPAWCVLLALFGTRALLDHVGSGTADMLVTTLGAIAVMLHVASWDDPRLAARSPVVAIALFGSLSAKATGVCAGLSLLALHAAWRRDPAPMGAPPVAPTRALAWQVTAAAVLATLPLVQQLVASLTVPNAALDPTEVNFRLLAMRGMLTSARDSDTTMADALLELAGSWGAHQGPVLALGLGILVLGAALDRRMRWLCLPVAAHVLLWSRALSYDLRNLMPSLPFLALVLAGGGRFLARRAVSRLERFGGAALALGLASIATWSIATGVQRQVQELTQRDFGLRERLAALRDGVDARVFQFFLHYHGDYTYLRALDPGRHGSRLLAASPLYRCFPGAGYPISAFPWARLRAGDVYVAWPRWQPGNNAWTLVREDPRSQQRTWILTPRPHRVPHHQLLLTGTHPPRALRQTPHFTLVRFAGHQSLVVFDVLRLAPPPGSWIAWRLETETADAGIEPLHMAYDPDIIDAAASTTMIEPASQGLGRTYSGLLVLRDRPLSTRPTDGLLVGIVSGHAAGARVLGLEYSVLPPQRGKAP